MFSYKNIPNTITLSSMILGFFSLITAMRDDYFLATLFVYIAMIVDGLDGNAARLLNVKSETGKQLDSFADAISFGISPAFVLFAWSEQKPYNLLISCIYLICIILRLARFNIEDDENSDGLFTGIPSPVGTGYMLLPIVFEKVFGIYLGDFKPIIIPWVIIVSYCLIAKFPTPSFKFKFNKKVQKFLFLLSLSLLIVFIIYPYHGALIIGGIYIPASFILIPLSKKQKKLNLS